MVKRESVWKVVRFCALVVVGSAIFALGFDLFLEPNGINVGGMTGLGMVIREIIGVGTVGLISALLNVPLFLLGFRHLGKKFFFGSLLGLVVSTLFLELFAAIPVPQVEPLLAALYGLGWCFSPARQPAARISLRGWSSGASARRGLGS